MRLEGFVVGFSPFGFTAYCHEGCAPDIKSVGMLGGRRDKTRVSKFDIKVFGGWKLEVFDGDKSEGISSGEGIWRGHLEKVSICDMRYWKLWVSWRESSMLIPLLIYVAAISESKEGPPPKRKTGDMLQGPHRQAVGGEEGGVAISQPD